MNYTPNWNLTTIPDSIFMSEYGRRRSSLRRTFTGGRNGGKPKVPTACKCGEMCESWRAAQRHCPPTPLNTTKSPADYPPGGRLFPPGGNGGADWPENKWVGSNQEGLSNEGRGRK